MPPTGNHWIARFAERVGLEAPSDDEIATVLLLAGVAAHSSERTAAPVSCWLSARAGLSPSEGLDVAVALAAEFDAGGSP